MSVVDSINDGKKETELNKGSYLLNMYVTMSLPSLYQHILPGEKFSYNKNFDRLAIYNVYRISLNLRQQWLCMNICNVACTMNSLMVSSDHSGPKEEEEKPQEPREEEGRTEKESNIHVKAGVGEVRLTLHSSCSGNLADVRVKGTSS